MGVVVEDDMAKNSLVGAWSCDTPYTMYVPQVQQIQIAIDLNSIKNKTD